MDVPSGEVTFLLSDVEGSTARWEAEPGSMRAALRRHDELSRDAIERHGGFTVKHTGDGFLAAFATADAAVPAAIEIQRGMRATTWPTAAPLQVRIGVHTGEAKPEGGDYHAPVVNRCARVMGAAHGGQILVTEATRIRWRAARPEIGFEPLGAHRLPDLAQAEVLYQVRHPDLPGTFPPLRSLETSPHNLPVARSALVGRDAAVAELAELVRSHRIVTLTGPGGVGKTRLALQVAAELAPEFRDGVWLVELGPLAAPELVARTVAATLRVPHAPGRSSLERLRPFVAARELLLLLDNAEHLTPAVAAVADMVVAASARSRVLATSREPLALDGEYVWEVPPLEVASDGEHPSAAVELFVERAVASGGAASVRAADPVDLEALCRRLDGLPLAIELAAARTRALSIGDLRGRLEDRFRLLRSSNPVAVPRQRTLEATVAWSYDLLDPAEQRLFRALSVFAAPFGAASAVAVCAELGMGEPEALDGLLALNDRSLLAAEPGGDATSYRMLETIRAFGRQRLEEAGEADAVRTRHLAWARERATAAGPALDGPEQAGWLATVGTELDEFRSAMSFALATGEVTAGATIAAQLYRFWYVAAVREGRSWLERFAGSVDRLETPLAAHVLYAYGSLLQVTGAYQHSAEVLSVAVDHYRSLENRRGLAYALHYLARSQWGIEPIEDVRARFLECEALFRELDDPVGLGLSSLFLGVYEFVSGRPERGVEIMRECDPLMRRIGAPQLVAHGAEMLAWGLAQTGRHDEAMPLFVEAGTLYERIGNRACGAHYLDNVALALGSGRPHGAAVLLASNDRLREEIRVPAPPYEDFSRRMAEARVEQRLDAGVARAAAEEGRQLGFEEALRRARELLTTGEVGSSVPSADPVTG